MVSHAQAWTEVSTGKRPVKLKQDVKGMRYYNDRGMENVGPSSNVVVTKFGMKDGCSYAQLVLLDCKGGVCAETLLAVKSIDLKNALDAQALTSFPELTDITDREDCSL